jgi:hypothetical protein
MATPTKALAVAQSLSQSELMDLLGQTGMLSSGGDGFHRMSLKSGSLVTDPGQPNEETWPPTKRGPVMTVRIVKPPIYYNAFFLDINEKNGAIDPRRINREDLDKKFVKKYDDANEQANDQWSNVEVYDQLVEATGGRGSFKADIQLQIVPEDGQMTGDEKVYSLSLSTTSALDWRGSSKNPQGGVVQEKNFIVQLAELAQAEFIEAGGKGSPAQAVLDAMTSLRLGGVVAEVYLIQTSNPQRPAESWTVVAFKPVHIEPLDQLQALESGDPVAAGPETDSDAIPF